MPYISGALLMVVVVHLLVRITNPIDVPHSSSARATKDHDLHSNMVVMDAVYFSVYGEYFRLAHLHCPQT